MKPSKPQYSKKWLEFLLQEKDEKIEKLEILVECLYNKVALNEEQEELLDKVLFGSDKE